MYFCTDFKKEINEALCLVLVVRDLRNSKMCKNKCFTVRAFCVGCLSHLHIKVISGPLTKRSGIRCHASVFDLLLN